MIGHPRVAERAKPLGLGVLPALENLSLRSETPSWLLSAVFHFAALIGLALWLHQPGAGPGSSMSLEFGWADPEPTSPAEMAPIAMSVAETAAVSSEPSRPDPPLAPAEGPVRSLADALAGTLAVDPDSALPRATSAVASGGAFDSTDVRGAMSGPPTPSGGSIGGKAVVGVFGARGEGYKFVYVFDRSGSMGGEGRSALEAAKAELLASLRALDRTHQFQIIFYNDEVTKFNPTGDPDRLVFATEQNKQAAARFLATITAEGGTQHEKALSAALKLRPDVIFFLTDADEPKLYPAQLQRIQRLAGGTTINAIEFGFGPRTDHDNFLMRLARQNNGQYVYVDVSKLMTVGR